jgi:Zn-dependent M28 family amino/carboxypeptidase
MSVLRAVICIMAASIAGGCASAREPGTAPPPDRDRYVSELPRSVSTARLRQHLAALQRIADANGGTRVAASPGYAASVRYVRDALAAAGYRPSVSTFPFTSYRERREVARQLTPIGRPIRVEAIDYSPSTPAGGLRGRVAPADNGCEPGDFAGTRGRIAIAGRGACFIFQKAQNAAAAGASALLVFTTEPGPIDATLGDPNASRIPVAAIEAPIARSLLGTNDATVNLEITTEKRRTTSQNVIASTHAQGRVLLVGAHLDSVLAGPGINDNGTGVAALLELARVLRARAPRLAVRIAFWGSEEFGLVGSRAYASGVDPAQLAGYLNFDMLGTRGGSVGVYQGRFAPRLLGYFKQRGLRAEVVDLTGRSDHFPFEQIGVPTGGLFAGVDGCYHARCDRLAAVDLTLLTRLASGAAFGVASIAPIRPS